MICTWQAASSILSRDSTTSPGWSASWISLWIQANAGNVPKARSAFNCRVKQSKDTSGMAWPWRGRLYDLLKCQEPPSWQCHITEDCTVQQHCYVNPRSHTKIHQFTELSHLQHIRTQQPNGTAVGSPSRHLPGSTSLLFSSMLYLLNATSLVSLLTTAAGCKELFTAGLTSSVGAEGGPVQCVEVP